MKDRNFWGVGEPWIQRERDTGVPASAFLDLASGMGMGAIRSWMHIPEILISPEEINRKAAERHHEMLSHAAEQNLEVTGMSHEWFLPEGCYQRRGHAMPPRNLTEGSLYMQALTMLEESWETMAREFPEVAIWEVGNEWNTNIFLSPDGFMTGDVPVPFTMSEKMDIAVDLMYFSAKGIRKGNPNAKVASFSPTFSHPDLGGDMPDYLPMMYGIAWTLDQVYSRIKSGNFWSDQTDDYFDLVAWHPYHVTLQPFTSEKEMWLNVGQPDSLWKDYNDAAYRVMCRYGDGHKQVLMTETGFTDCGDPEIEKRNASYMESVVKLAMEMPYVRTIHHFRLLNETGMLNRKGAANNQIGGLTEVYFGMFEEPSLGCMPRQRAKKSQR